MTDVSNKMALVTGASRGIGRASVLALAEANVRVIVHYGRSMTEANAVVEEIRSAGGQADAVQADLGTPDGATTLARRVRKLAGKTLDILVSNAGVSKAVAFEDYTFEDFDTLFMTNVRSPFFLDQHLLSILADGSSIVLVSSLAARAVPGNPRQADAPSLSAYAATKGALETLVNHSSPPLAPRLITLNSL